MPALSACPERSRRVAEMVFWTMLVMLVTEPFWYGFPPLVYFRTLSTLSYLSRFVKNLPLQAIALSSSHGVIALSHSLLNIWIGTMGRNEDCREDVTRCNKKD